MNNENCLPRLRDVIFNDWPVFLLVFGPVLFSVFAMVMYISQEYPFKGYLLYDILITTISFIALSFCLWPFVIWWFLRIKNTFLCPIEIMGTVTSVWGLYGPYIGIYYEFTYNGEILKHSATLLSNKRTIKVAKEKNVTIFYNSKYGISFIKEVFCP